jgi:hypothetical protein
MINKKRKPTPVKVTVKATEKTPPEVTQTDPEQEEKITAPVEEKTPKKIKRRDYDIPLGYGAVVPKFKTCSKVRVVSRSSPYSEPIKDSFRFRYMVEYESNGLTAVSRFTEEELIGLSE